MNATPETKPTRKRAPRRRSSQKPTLRVIEGALSIYRVGDEVTSDKQITLVCPPNFPLTVEGTKLVDGELQLHFSFPRGSVFTVPASCVRRGGTDG
jgi:hypothetical protein